MERNLEQETHNLSHKNKTTRLCLIYCIVSIGFMFKILSDMQTVVYHIVDKSSTTSLTSDMSFYD